MTLIVPSDSFFFAEYGVPLQTQTSVFDQSTKKVMMCPVYIPGHCRI